MKIATWNVERLKHKSALERILAECKRTDADIFVLTETDARVRPEYRFCFQTPPVAELYPAYYKPTENRVSVFTNYPLARRYPTYDRYTSLCVELETERGNLLVYGTIIGIYGNRHASFWQDLLRQLEDIRRLSAAGALCVCGDFNCSFADNYYYTKSGRAALRNAFAENRIALLTENVPQCIDHVAVSKRFLDDDVQIHEWNLDKTLSDHKGIVVSL